MKNLVFAAIDIGSYNCRLTIVEKKSDQLKTLHSFSCATNLIKNLSFNNEFTIENTKKTVECLKNFSEKLKKFEVDCYRCIATEACRQVINPEFFVDRVKNVSGINVEVISSYEEAKLSLNSCANYIKRMDQRGIIFDIGGGSTEISFFNKNREIINTSSISYGVINLSEKKDVYGRDFVKNHLKSHFQMFRNEEFENLKFDIKAIGSCSTVTILCAIYQNLNFFNLKKIEGFIMNTEKLSVVSNSVQKSNKENLKKISFIGSRYELLLNGIEILKYILDLIPISEIIVTQRGLKEGIMQDLVSENEKNKTK